ncbi:MAG: ACP S-malonyltransferase [Actinomycetota bacterium]|nr:ACP S-malonyltransferase [Actinomycetota bacterium]
MNETTTAIVFPGQGSQEEGMRRDVERERPDLLEAVIEAVGEDPFERVGEGTRFDQPAIFCAGLAGYERLGRPTPELFAGHSLGELTALTAAGVLAEEDAVGLVALRGRLTDEAAAAAGGGMLVLRAGREQAGEIAERSGLALANDNAPEQVVLSGDDEALEAGERVADEAGVRAKRLPVAGAFHSPLMEPAVAPFKEAVDAVEIAAGTAPVFSCVTCAPFDDVPFRLSEALVSPVRWLEIMKALHGAGARRFVEPGPGSALSGLLRRTLDDVEIEGPERPDPADA